MRQEKRIKMNENVRHRENMIALGKHGRYFKLILGEHTPFNTLDSLDTPSGIITDPRTIHETLTTHMNNHHSTPLRHQNGIHQRGWNWQTGGTKQDFLNSIQHHNIPTHLTDIIWTAMTDIPKSTIVRSELSSIFESPPSFEDFCNAIKEKPHKKAGDLTGTTSYLHGALRKYQNGGNGKLSASNQRTLTASPLTHFDH